MMIARRQAANGGFYAAGMPGTGENFYQNLMTSFGVSPVMDTPTAPQMPVAQPAGQMPAAAPMMPYTGGNMHQNLAGSFGQAPRTFQASDFPAFAPMPQPAFDPSTDPSRIVNQKMQAWQLEQDALKAANAVDAGGSSMFYDGGGNSGAPSAEDAANAADNASANSASDTAGGQSTGGEGEGGTGGGGEGGGVARGGRINRRGGGDVKGGMDPRDDITSNENFNAWFGNSVAHDNGVPIRFYHGTSKDKDFTSFNMGKHGVWLTTDPEEASAYAEQNDSQGYSYASGKIEPTNIASRVIPVYLKAENPYTGDLPEQFKSDNYKKAQSTFFDQLRAAGYDSWIPEKQNGKLAVALGHPTQIKSAVGNNGNFSPKEKHIARADGGEIMPQRDLGADPTVQRAMDVTRQVQPTAPQMARQLNEQGMYSHAAEVAAGLPQTKGSPQQMLAMLSSRGVKPDEIKYSGAQDAFGNQKAVTKDQLAQHFQQNMPQIEKVVLGSKEPFDEQRLAQLEKEYLSLSEHPIDAPSFGEDKYNEMIRLMNIRDQSSTQSLFDAAERAMRQAQRAHARNDWGTAERYFREYELLNTRAEKLDLEGQGLSKPTKYRSFTLPGGENYREVLFKAKDRNADQLEAAQNKRYELRLLYDEAMENYKKISESNPGHPDAVASYEKVNDARSAWRNAEKKLSDLQEETADRTYKSSHWDEPNVLSHVRLLDRKAPSGKKVLHVEEIQSDWAQEGRREGFKDIDALKNYQKKTRELRAQFEDADKAHTELTNRLAPRVNETFRPGEENPREYADRINALEEKRQQLLAEHPEWKASVKRLQEIRDAYQTRWDQGPSETGAPVGPYVTNTQAWTDFALKAVLKEAVEGGYDRIAWTNGQDQADRYDLSKHIDSVHYNPGMQNLSALDKNGREVLNEDAEPHEIQKHIGKELADKLLADVPDLHSAMNEHDIEKDPETRKWGIYLYGDPVHDYGGDPLEFDSKGEAKDHLKEMVQESLNNHTSTLRNVDLVVGGEGMKSYYDKIVPTRVMEVTKKLGAPVKVEPHTIKTEEGENTLHSIKVTPELKAAVMRGMPAYNTGGTVGYANGGIAFDNPVIQQALRIAAKKRPMVALADLFQKQLRGRQ